MSKPFCQHHASMHVDNWLLEWLKGISACMSNKNQWKLPINLFTIDQFNLEQIYFEVFLHGEPTKSTSNQDNWWECCINGYWPCFWQLQSTQHKIIYRLWQGSDLWLSSRTLILVSKDVSCTLICDLQGHVNVKTNVCSLSWANTVCNTYKENGSYM